MDFVLLPPETKWLSNFPFAILLNAVLLPITGSPAGLCRVNGDGQCSAKMVTSTVHQSHNYESFDFKFGKGYNVMWFTNPAEFGYDCISGGAPTWWWNMGVASILFLLIFLFFFFPSDTYSPNPRTDFHARSIAQKTRFDVRKCPLIECFSEFWLFGVIFPENPTNFAGSREIPAKMKKSNNSLAVEDRQNMSIEHA